MDFFHYLIWIVIAYLFVLTILNIYLLILRIRLKKKKLFLNEIELSKALVKYKISLCESIASGKKK